MKSRIFAALFSACLLTGAAFAGDIQFKAEPLIITAIP